jgi:hypothetical protein
MICLSIHQKKADEAQKTNQLPTPGLGTRLATKDRVNVWLGLYQFQL